MEIQFETTLGDNKNFLKKYFFKKYFGKRLFLSLLLPLWMASFREADQPFILAQYLLKAAIVALVLLFILVLVPYVVLNSRFKKALQNTPPIRRKSISTEDGGIRVIAEDHDMFLRWTAIKDADMIGEYLYIALFDNQFHVIPLRFFSSEGDKINFLGELKRGVASVHGEKTGRHLYGRGWLGLIPLVGAFIGVWLALMGWLKYKDRKLVLIGCAAIGWTVAIYGSMFYYFQFSQAGAQQSAELSKMLLNNLVKDIEFYKLQHGTYPDSLGQLRANNEPIMIDDPLSSRKFDKSKEFNYKRLDGKYTLYSSGIDKMPNTQDDIYPTVKESDSSKIGLIVN